MGARGRGGGVRGRGASRGRSGASRGIKKGFKGKQKRPQVTSAVGKDHEEGEDVNLSISVGDVRGLFVHSTSFQQHLDSQNLDRDYYHAALLVLIEHKLELSSGSKARALAAAMARRDAVLMNCMLDLPEIFGMVEVTKALNMLDAGRQLKRLTIRQEKLSAMKDELGYKIKKSKFSKLKNQIGNLELLKTGTFTFTGALAKTIRRWTSKIPAERLQFFALYYPKEPWKKVADLVHFNSKTDFQVEWFLPFCFGGPAPAGTLVDQCSKITKENLNDIVRSLNVPYSYLKQFSSWFNEETKEYIAQKETLTTVIWWYEDLKTDKVNKLIYEKLLSDEKVNFTYGKLMERIFTLRSFTDAGDIVKKLVEIAEIQLREISLTLDSPIAVLGDKSASMQVCVKTSNIIASLLSMICDAHINFFDDRLVDAPFHPSSVEKVLDLSEEIKANRSTAPAASLYPFYEKKETIKTFIVVTDEEENSKYKNFNFKGLYEKYAEEVHKAKLVFVSFLRSQKTEGNMVRELKKLTNVPEIQQFRFDQSRPDLNKLDHMFAVLSTSGDWYEREVKHTKERIQGNPTELEEIMKNLRID